LKFQVIFSVFAGKKNNQATINGAIAQLRSFFNCLIDREIIKVNPMHKIKKGKVDQKPIIPFPNEDIKKTTKTA